MPDYKNSPSNSPIEDLEEQLRLVRINREEWEQEDQTQFGIQVNTGSAKVLEKLIMERLEEWKRAMAEQASTEMEEPLAESLESVHHDIKKEEDNLLYG